MSQNKWIPWTKAFKKPRPDEPTYFLCELDGRMFCLFCTAESVTPRRNDVKILAWHQLPEIEDWILESEAYESAIRKAKPEGE